MEKSLKTLYCPECGGTNVQVQAWVNANTKEFCGFINGPFFDEDDCWCEDCEDHVELCILKELWDKFADIPINNNDEIEQDFMCFNAGDSRFDVWHWFDERCPNGLAVDLMGETPKDKNALQE